MKTIKKIIEKHYKMDKDEDGNKVWYEWNLQQALEEYGKLMYNQAIDDAADNADADFTEIDRGKNSLPLIEVYVIKDSILKLKK